MAATLLTIADLAARLESDPRTTRKFLRSITPADEQPGKGKRWAIPATQVRSLKSQFVKYQSENVKSQDTTSDPKVGEVETQHDAEVAELED
jgi:hypothetical protein